VITLENCLFAFARKKRADFIGLELGPKALRLLQLELKDDGWLIKNYARVPLPAATIIDGKIQQADLLHDLLSQLVTQTQTQGCAAAVAMPANAVISQQVALPSHLPVEEYDSAISMNLGRYFPGVTDILYFDFLSLPASATTRREVFLVVARQWQVDSYAAAVNAAGLRTQVVDVDYFALLRTIPLSVANFSANHVVAVVHGGFDHVTLIIFTRQIILLQQRWHGMDVSAIQQTLASYPSVASQPPLDYLVVSGDIQAADCEKIVDVKIVHADPLGSMRVAPSVDEQHLRGDAKNLAVCCGLALRGYDKGIKCAGNKFITVA
jgi:Tfp pilus assembly PilM family ATPase